MYNVTLYRVLQEALTNIVKHAQAGHAWVELGMEDDSVSLTIQDNGQGFVDGMMPTKRHRSGGLA
jgi:signal transduction histidine kinase